MKRLLLILALAMPMLQVLATPPSTIENVILVTKVEERSLVVQLANLQKEKTVVTLESLNGKETFHTQTINAHNGYLTRLNMDELPTGKYILRIKQESGTLRQVVVVDQNSILTSKIAEN